MSLLHSPKIVTNGLVLCLDAGSRKSYPGTGTVWKDLSGNGNDGTLVNGVGYDSSNKGSLVFNGTNHRVNARESNIFNNFSYDIWCLPNATHQIDTESASTVLGTAGQRYIIGPQYVDPGAGSGISVGTNGISVYEHSIGYMPALLVYSISINSPIHIVVNYTNKVPSLYINGVFIKNGLTSPRTNVKITTDLLGYYTYGFFSGKLFSAKFYNNPLNIDQIQQNFNALRGRFGI